MDRSKYEQLLSTYNTKSGRKKIMSKDKDGKWVAVPYYLCREGMTEEQANKKREYHQLAYEKQKAQSAKES